MARLKSIRNFFCPICGKPVSKPGNLCKPCSGRTRAKKESDRLAALQVVSDNCYGWLAATDDDGYGLFTRHGGKQIAAHRMAMIIALGRELVPGEQVLHHCDNPPCTRLDHLFLGTHRINHEDKRVKLRAPQGEGHGRHKLTADLVYDVLTRYANGESQTAIAAELGVSQPSISAVVLRKTWRLVIWP